MNSLTKPHNNQELFSNYYLNERLPQRSEWKEAEGVEKAYQDISRRYGDKKDILSSTKEKQTEEELIQPIPSEILGFNQVTKTVQSLFN